MAGKISSVDAVNEKCPDHGRRHWPLALDAVLVLGIKEAAVALAAMQDYAAQLAQVVSVFKVELAAASTPAMRIPASPRRHLMKYEWSCLRSKAATSRIYEIEVELEPTAPTAAERPSTVACSVPGRRDRLQPTVDSTGRVLDRGT